MHLKEKTKKILWGGLNGVLGGCGDPVLCWVGRVMGVSLVGKKLIYLGIFFNKIGYDRDNKKLFLIKTFCKDFL